jgi:hypothetical protein
MDNGELAAIRHCPWPFADSFSAPKRHPCPIRTAPARRGEANSIRERVRKKPQQVTGIP